MGHRQDIIAACKKLEADGLNRGASGNVSVRDGDAMLITPSAITYDMLQPEMIARMPLSSEDMNWEGPNNPSSEWRIHRDILRDRPDINAVVHTHAPFATILAVAHQPIPAIHYIMAAFGGPDIRLCDYAGYGTAELSGNVVSAMKDRQGCLMANHGMVVGGKDLTHAMWLAGELEALAHQHYHALAIGGAKLLSDAQIEETARGIKSYGVRSRDDTS